MKSKNDLIWNYSICFPWKLGSSVSVAYKLKQKFHAIGIISFRYCFGVSSDNQNVHANKYICTAGYVYYYCNAKH